MRAMIVDDEAPGRKIIRQYLEDFREVRIVAESADGVSAVEMIRIHRPDLLFLDIQMPGLGGFEVLEGLSPRELPPHVIFSTAHDDYAIRAFEVSAVDYLLKPFDRARFSAVAR